MIVLVAIFSVIALWALFLAYADLKRFAPTLRPEVKVAGLLIIFAGFCVDVGVNWTLGLLLGITPDATLSQKCKRLKRGTGWRAKVADYICANWLNPFDTGHC